MKVPEIYQMLVDSCYITEDKLERFISLYQRLPEPFKRNYEPLTRKEFGEFISLQREMLEARVEAGDEEAKEQMKDFKRKLKTVLQLQEIMYIGYL